MSVRISNTNSYPLEIPNATETDDGAMSKEDKQKLDGLSGGALAFQYTIEAGDGDDFIVEIPAGKEQSSGDYSVTMTIQSGSINTSYRIPYADQTATEFRVVTDAPLDVGTRVGFTIAAF